MGWLYMQSIAPYKTPKEYLNNQLTFESEKATYRVLQSALVAMRHYYAAVEIREKTTNKRDVNCVICLVNYKPLDKEGFIFGYKDMDESMGPYVTDCPASILDLLTPTDSAYANEWREKCRRRLNKIMPKQGDSIVLSTPLKFKDGTTQERFRAIELEIGKRKRLVFAGSTGAYYRLPNLKDLDFTIESRSATLTGKQQLPSL
jgi:hypothetical protein